ncbi:unnamed protein product, partial [marine sediment metagenome]
QGDPGRVRQVITNLVGNAAKFTSEGEVSIRVTLDKEDNAKAKLRFAVNDTGIGIPANRIDSLFEAFTQADASTTRKFGGTGLGLTISKRLCEMMGGKIGVESEVGKGSTFWFTAVFKKQAESRQLDSDVAKIEEASLAGMRILAVDDNATNRLLLEKQLKSWNFRHDEAQDGETALAKLGKAVKQKDPFVIAIVDMQMPGMDGEVLGRKIKEDKSLRDTQLVMMTSMGQRGDAARVKKMGFAAYLTKPVKQSDLLDCLVNIISGEKGKKEPGTTPLITRHSIA